MYDRTNLFAHDILVFNQAGTKIRAPVGTASAFGGFQPAGLAVEIAFENGFRGGRLFANDSNQSLRTAGNNNSSRVVTVNPVTGQVQPFITGLPTGDHPTEQLAFKDGWLYWSQGSTTNSGVVGRDNGGGAKQPGNPCPGLVFSNKRSDSGGGAKKSGESRFRIHRPRA